MAQVFGVELKADLDPGFGTPVDVLVIVKCLKPEQDMQPGEYPYQLAVRSSRISTWEAYGMAAYVQEIAFDESLYGDAEPGP